MAQTLEKGYGILETRADVLKTELDAVVARLSHAVPGARGPEDARCCRAAAAWRRFRCSSGRPNRLGCSQTEVRVRASTALERAQTAAAWLC